MRPIPLIGLLLSVAIACADKSQPDPLLELQRELVGCRRELVASWNAPQAPSAQGATTAAGSSPEWLSPTPIILDPAELDVVVDRVVEVRGVVLNTKIPSVAGLLLDGAEALRGKRVHLKGTVTRYVIPLPAADENEAKYGPPATLPT